MPRLAFLLSIGLTGVAVLAALGAWQVQRLTWKRALLEDIETRIAAAPVDLPDAVDPVRDLYLRVRVSGTFLPGEAHVLVSRKRLGAGYRILAPFLTEAGRRIVIDRGFVRDTAKAAPRAPGPAEIDGNLHWPDEVDGFTPPPDRAANIWFARDLERLAQEFDSEPVLVVARSRTDPGIEPLPLGTEGIPNDHLQYAITWFSLALIWAAMTVYFLRRARPAAGQRT